MDEGYEREADIFMEELTMPPQRVLPAPVLRVGRAGRTAREVRHRRLRATDNIVFSTDNPHGDSKYPAAVDNFFELPFTDEDRRKILWDNCARFYSIAGVPSPA